MKIKIIILGILLSLSMIHTQSNDTVATIEVVDNRAEIIDNYYKERNMPLEGYGLKMVEVADKYNLDWRLLPAITIRETSGGKYMCKNPKAQNNPFGWGSCKIGFESIDNSIDTVAYKLSTLPVYKGKSTSEILYYYNGTVVKTYPEEVLRIMDSLQKIPL